MNPIRTNKPVFFGDDGEVLKSGNIYIGQPNQWPLSFPKTVTFQDSAGSQFTAAQPLRTNGQGRIEYNGKAVMALVDGNYSMLVRDRNGVTVADGYTPFVSNVDSGGGSTEGVTQVGLLLSDIKQLNVTPGETVRNVGKSTTLDGLGADWLVVSATGSPGDDVDLIDFANGTQGRRIDNFAYSAKADDTGLILLDDPSVVVNVGDAGISGYREQWSSIDLSSEVPSNASSAVVRVYCYGKYPNSTTASRLAIRAYARKTGSTIGPPSDSQATVGADYQVSSANAELESAIACDFSIPLDPPLAANFDLYIQIQDPLVGSGNITLVSLVVSVIGYEIRYTDAEI